ncbi:MAG: PD40 domain-containing protein [Flavobacteriales bacterium]|nr:PD40 domain-containing protein [Flavobacteriales bacterium]
MTKDGQRLFFTSDKPGGIGGKDIYVSYRDGTGAWGEPQNLGPTINTEGDEMFPYVNGNTLYFSSDGHLGLGGLDIFSVTLRGKGFGIVENLNAPINSAYDDFGLCLDERGEIGFLTSDRDGHIGSEDIYTFVMNSKAEDNRKWIGRVLDMSDAQPIPYLTVRLFDAEHNEIARTTTSLKEPMNSRRPRWPHPSTPVSKAGHKPS